MDAKRASSRTSNFDIYYNNTCKQPMNVHVNHSTMLERHILYSTCSTSTIVHVVHPLQQCQKGTSCYSIRVHVVHPLQVHWKQQLLLLKPVFFFCHNIAEVKSLFVIKLFSNICSNSIIYNKFKYVINLKINSLCPLHGILAYNTSYRSSANLVTTCN